MKEASKEVDIITSTNTAIATATEQSGKYELETKDEAEKKETRKAEKKLHEAAAKMKEASEDAEEAASKMKEALEEADDFTSRSITRATEQPTKDEFEKKEQTKKKKKKQTKKAKRKVYE